MLFDEIPDTPRYGRQSYTSKIFPLFVVEEALQSIANYLLLDLPVTKPFIIQLAPKFPR
jgi:hypothetical protein